MIRRLFGGIFGGMLIFAVAIFIGYVSYTLTCSYHDMKTKSVSAAEMSEPETEDTASDGYQNTAPEKVYTARLEGNAISIYAKTVNGEEFLYSLGINPGDLSETDLRLLQEGIVLEGSQRLAAFEEDFTH